MSHWAMCAIRATSPIAWTCAKTESAIPVAEHRPQKAPLIVEDELFIFGEFEGGNALWVAHRLLAVTFVGRQAWKGEHRHGDVVGAFGWQEIAVMLATEFFYQGDPQFSVMLDGLELVGVDNVFQVAGDHRCSLGVKIFSRLYARAVSGGTSSPVSQPSRLSHSAGGKPTTLRKVRENEAFEALA